MTTLNVTLTGDKEVALRLSEMPNKVRSFLFVTVTRVALYLENYVKTNKLQGQVLNHISGRLQSSIHSSSSQTGSRVGGIVFSAAPMPYAAIHEFGGFIPAHIIEVKNALALHFVKGGKDVFAKSVNWPGATMPERSYMRSSLADNKDKIVAEMKAAVMEAVKP